MLQLNISDIDKYGTIKKIIDNVHIPKMVRIKQIIDCKEVRSIPLTVKIELSKPEIISLLKPKMKIAITVGSRGISNYAEILKEIITNLKKHGCEPFIIPAMGSHGFATAEGQVEILNHFGITEESMEVPIKSSMETVLIGRTIDDNPVFIDKFAYDADGIVVIGRIKPHTAFHGEYESGLLKMMTIGMGKQKGADICHKEGFGKMAYNIETFADVIMEKTKILFGIAIIENSFNNTHTIESIAKKHIKTREKELLRKAKNLMAKLPIQNFDILIVDQIGKNFSGDGADPNITGTYTTPYASGGPKYQRYVILDIADESCGNVSGLGMADFTTIRVFNKIDFDTTYPNALTSRIVSGVKIPMVLNSDRAAIQSAIFSCVDIDLSKPKIVKIRNTSHIDEIMISEALIPEVEKNRDLRIEGTTEHLLFNNDGNLYL